MSLRTALTNRSSIFLAISVCAPVQCVECETATDLTMVMMIAMHTHRVFIAGKLTAISTNFPSQTELDRIFLEHASFFPTRSFFSAPFFNPVPRIMQLAVIMYT